MSWGTRKPVRIKKTIESLFWIKSYKVHDVPLLCEIDDAVIMSLGLEDILYPAI